jgi:hypothetical protein
VDGEYKQRELDYVQVMPRGEMSRYIPKLRPGEEVHYTMGGGIVISQGAAPDPYFVTEIWYDPNSERGRYMVKYSDGHEHEISKEYAESLREQMEARHAKP